MKLSSTLAVVEDDEYDRLKVEVARQIRDIAPPWLDQNV